MSDNGRESLYPKEYANKTVSTGRYVNEVVDGIPTGRKVWTPFPQAVKVERVEADPAGYVRFTVDDPLERNIALTMLKLYELFRDRQRKYGPGNIAAFGDRGVVVRATDKLARLRNHYENGVGDMPDESVNDAWSDLAVYGVIALVCREGRWPGYEQKAKDGRE